MTQLTQNKEPGSFLIEFFASFLSIPSVSGHRPCAPFKRGRGPSCVRVNRQRPYIRRHEGWGTRKSGRASERDKAERPDTTESMLAAGGRGGPSCLPFFRQGKQGKQAAIGGFNAWSCLEKPDAKHGSRNRHIMNGSEAKKGIAAVPMPRCRQVRCPAKPVILAQE